MNSTKTTEQRAVGIFKLEEEPLYSTPQQPGFMIRVEDGDILSDERNSTGDEESVEFR